MTAEICYFSTHIIPPVTILTEHKTNFFTHVKKKKKKKIPQKIMIISKGYLWQIIWVFHVWEKIGIKREHKSQFLNPKNGIKVHGIYLIQ